MNHLGLLSRIAATACSIEPYRNAPTVMEVRSCVLKLLWMHMDLERRANREERTLSESELPQLWILTPTASTAFLNSVGAKPQQSWPQGVYFTANVLKAGIVAIHQLPVQRDTLWLRLLGKGRTQQQAIEEAIALPLSDPMRARALESLANWKIIIETNSEIAATEEGLSMALSPAYLEWKRQTEIESERRGLEQGLEQGLERGLEQGLQQLQQERRMTLESLLQARYGALDAELVAVIDACLSMSADQYARELPVLLSLSREELLRRFGQSS